MDRGCFILHALAGAIVAPLTAPAEHQTRRIEVFLPGRGSGVISSRSCYKRSAKGFGIWVD